MKEKLRMLLPYFLVGTATCLAIFAYLMTANKREKTSLYLFDRTYIQKAPCQLVRSEQKTPVEGYVSASTKTGLANAIAYLELDSVHAYVVLAKPDTMPQYPTGLYRYDRVSREALTDSCLCPLNLSDQYENVPQRLLAYDGKFSKQSDGFVLSFLHFSDVFVFNRQGRLRYRMKTEDHVPPPSVVKYRDYYLYERGKAFNTNMAVFTHGDHLYSFSLKISSGLTQYLVDCYDIDKSYQYSFYIDNVCREDNLYIESVTVEGDTVTIESRNGITKIKMQQ